jgi:hypothetical protein
MKNKIRNIIFSIGTLLFSYLIYLHGIQDQRQIREKYSLNMKVISTTPIYKKADINSKIIDTLIAGTRLRVGKLNGGFYQIIFSEENNNRVKRGYISKREVGQMKH